MNHPLLPLPTRIPDADTVYAVLGRALAYVTEFESNCRNLAHEFHTAPSSPSDYAYEIYTLAQQGTLNQKIQQFVTEFKLPEGSAEKLQSARKARNLIAHEIAKDHIERMKTEAGRRSLQSIITIAVQDVVDGNQIVLDMTRMLRSGERGHGSDVIAYHSAVMDWVLP